MEKLNILIIGGGGREHAIAWKLSQEKRVGRLYCAPGNAGISRVAQCIQLKVDDVSTIVSWALQNKINLVIVGPELPLTLGLVDALAGVGIRAFGPSKKAAEIEGSKAFAKNLMQKYGIPTAKYAVFTDRESALSFARGMKGPWVVKADGLAAGKGVLICKTIEDTKQAVEEVLTDKSLGDAGKKIVIEEFLEGEELSILAFCDGKTAIPMVPAQDHKQIFDGDQGPNTGGMGAYSPVPLATPALLQEIEQSILRPILQAMEQEGKPYCGVLYPGLMITAEGPKVLEFNARFGDPETQVILPRLQTDLVEIILAALDKRLTEIQVKWEDQSCITVVMASAGYPGAYQKGIPIRGLERIPPDVLVFHSGTAFQGEEFVTAGGRVLSVTALGKDIKEAKAKAYRAVENIHFAGCQYRRDIAHRAD